MPLSKKPYKGTRDFFPAEKRVQDYLFAKMKEAAELFGMEPYNGPLLEEVELYQAKSGEELINDQIYSFTDRGERFVAIRPEMTPTLARMIAQVHREVPRPIRWYSIPNLMRYENPQRGRLREHWQLNCDIFGTLSPYSELEIFQFIIFLMQSFGADQTHFEILVNDKRATEAFCQHVLHLKDEESIKVIKLLDRSKKLSPDDLKKQLESLLPDQSQQQNFLQYLSLSSLQDVLKFAQQHQLEELYAPLIQVLELADKVNILPFLTFDPTIVRGLDYYTGIVFEVFDKHPNNHRAIAGGGAYARLLEIFGETALPGIGMGMGDVTLKDFLQTHQLLPSHLELPSIQLAIVSGISATEMPPELLIFAQELRKRHISVVTQPVSQKFPKALQWASKRGASFMGFFGDTEKDSQSLTIKNLSSGQQQNFKLMDIQSLVDFIQKS